MTFWGSLQTEMQCAFQFPVFMHVIIQCSTEFRLRRLNQNLWLWQAIGVKLVSPSYLYNWLVHHILYITITIRPDSSLFSRAGTKDHSSNLCANFQGKKLRLCLVLVLTLLQVCWSHIAQSQEIQRFWFRIFVLCHVYLHLKLHLTCARVYIAQGLE